MVKRERFKRRANLGGGYQVRLVIKLPLNIRCKKYGKRLRIKDLEKNSCINTLDSDEACSNLQATWDPLPEEADA